MSMNDEGMVCVDTLLLTRVPEIPEIDREGVGVEYRPDQDQVLLRPISTMKSTLLRERETSLVAGGHWGQRAIYPVGTL